MNRPVRLVSPLAALVLASGLAACGGTSSSPSSKTQSQGNAAAATNSTRPPQNDDYIHWYGHEPPPRERAQIVSMVNRYYAAIVAGDGATACRLLYPSIEKAVPEDYGKPPGPPALKGKTCAAVLSKLAKHVENQPLADLATTRVTGVRVKGEEGFVQLTASETPTGEISIQRIHGGGWRIEAIVGRACKNCAPG